MDYQKGGIVVKNGEEEEEEFRVRGCSQNSNDRHQKLLSHSFSVHTNGLGRQLQNTLFVLG